MNEWINEKVVLWLKGQKNMTRFDWGGRTPPQKKSSFSHCSSLPSLFPLYSLSLHFSHPSISSTPVLHSKPTSHSIFIHLSPCHILHLLVTCRLNELVKMTL